METVRTLEAALADKNVLASLSQAWSKSQSDGYEYGGWIYWDTARGIYAVKQTTEKSSCSIILTKPKDLEALQGVGCILADFHCHPYKGGFAKAINSGKPSDADITGAGALTYGRLVFTPKTDYAYKLSFAPLALPPGFVLGNDSTGKPEQAVMWRLK